MANYIPRMALAISIFFALALSLSCSDDSGNSTTPSLDPPTAITKSVKPTPPIAITPPAAPTGVVATANSTTSITIDWAAVTGATGYRIYRSPTSSGIYDSIGTSDSISYANTGLTSGTTYYYKVAAYNSGGVGPSSEVSAITPLVAPTGLAATINSATSITVSWTAVAGATGYRIYRDTTSSGTYDSVGVSTTTSYANTGLISGKTYYYKVAAYNSSGIGTQSDTASATTTSIVYGSVSDGTQTYKTVKIGERFWMAENLNYATATGSKCYEDKELNCERYGRLYTWAAAYTACPTGWRLPRQPEWQELMTAIGGTNTAGTKLKASSDFWGSGKGTDDYGFSALPGGYSHTDGSKGNIGETGYWWTGSESSLSSYAYRWTISYNSNSAGSTDYGKSYMFSVRCVPE
ncbi:hypothetical protein R83H12_00729 [Fibrobacteria bacterium R8-3-H12]